VNEDEAAPGTQATAAPATPVTPDDSAASGDAAARREVLRLAVEVAREVRPGQGAVPSVAIGSSLERDLGLDSLGRAELVARLERSFGVNLPDAVLGSAETPADLLRAIAAAAAAAPRAAVAGSRPAVVPAGTRDVAVGTADPRAAAAAAHSAGSAAAAWEEAAPAEAAPDRTRTLVEVLEWHAERHPERRHLWFYAGDGEPQELTYGGLLGRARRVAAGLRAAGVERREAVALMLPSGHDYFAAFCGVLLAGAVPVPLYPPARPRQIEDHLRRQAGILTTSQAVALISFPEVMTAARLLRAQVPGLARPVTVAELEGRGAGVADGAGGAAAAGTVAPAADDLAFLQFTSGSTGRPKGVMLTHANLLANLRAIGRAVAIGPRDVVVSWLPLYHDMGLIGSWMASLYYGMPLALMSPLAFLARPARWLQALSRHRGTLSAAPNFAYELCAAKIADDELAGVDLSAWRFALNGAEPVSPEAIRRFTARFLPYGFRPAAMAPVYGLAECSLALAFPPLERGPVVDVVERAAFERAGRAVPVNRTPAPGLPAAALPGEPGATAAADVARQLHADGKWPPGRAAHAAEAGERDATAVAAGRAAAGGERLDEPAGPDESVGPAGPAGSAESAGPTGPAEPAESAGPAVLRFVGCGMALPGHELRIVDAAGHEVAERQEGRLQFRGPSATSGYFRDPEATRRLRHGDWLDSGDRGYLVGRELFVTGRDKDIIIRAGRNLYPHELEEAVGEVPGIRKGGVAVFGVADAASGTERLVVLAETRGRAGGDGGGKGDEEARRQLRQAVQDATLALLGEPADEVVLAPPHSVPKTSSGKVRRAAARELYLGGRLGRGTGAMAVQLGRLALAGARVQLGRAARAAWALLYSAYVWSVFVIVALPLWLVLAPLPGLRRRRRLARAAARLMCRCAGIGLRVSGLEHLAPAPRSAHAPGYLLAVNHASYLDGVALTALLPPDFAFVAKRELEDSFFTRVIMRRLGALLVERFDVVQSAGEVPKAAAALAGGESLLIFPEGTFRRAPGLRPFRMGGFLAAAQAGAPVVPAVLRGTRHVFRDDAAIFRRGTVELEVLPPVAPDGDDWPAALRLRDRTRAALLAVYGEHDLAAGAAAD
jgi:1-acyl-sn-glycerol-3-phosphate acyltransferase